MFDLFGWNGKDDWYWKSEGICRFVVLGCYWDDMLIVVLCLDLVIENVGVYGVGCVVM